MIKEIDTVGSTRLQIAQRDILALFEARNQNVYKRSEIEKILAENRAFWRLAQSTSVRGFMDFLRDVDVFKEYKIAFPHRKEIRYVWKDISDYQLIQSLRPNSYFTHFTALFFHDLTLQIPKTVYLNYEQPKKKNPGGGLSQERIDFAFRNACRVSRTVAEFREKRICLLNGKFTGQKGVIVQKDEAGNDVRVTDIERTLIDSVVRPVYAGGVHTVLTAFERAANKVSINKLTAMLSALDYLYPYHQAIGFYLERSGAYSDKQIALIGRFEKHFNFYLSHQMKRPEYSERWRIYYPSGM